MTENLKPSNRIGLHYFPDTTHYREQDLKTWLPEFQALGANWLTVISPLERAIPEMFLQGLSQAGIEPVIHLPITLDQTSKDQQFHVLFENYARWGVRYLAPFDRPNIRRSWAASAWTQADLVERFLDLFVPAANALLSVGMIPVFPPLEPGGDYWDTAFLQSALRSLIRRGHQSLVQAMVLGINAWTFDRPLDWGKGGPECWPSTQPYFTPTRSQDQIGFHIFDWYEAIAQAETGRASQMMLLRTGSRLSAATQAAETRPADIFRQHAETNLAIIQMLAKGPQQKSAAFSLERNHLLSRQKQSELEPIDNILCANFWLLSTASDSEHVANAWYQPNGSYLPVVNAMKQWTAQFRQSKTNPAQSNSDALNPAESGAFAHPIEHYLLLPLYAWGVADWDLEAIRPFLQQHHPTVGFSVYEARLANRVTISGEAASLSEDTLTILRMAGCEVDCISQDGTLLAI